MDSDEFDDDIADEDLIAASQVPASASGRDQVSKLNQGRFQPHVNPVRPNSIIRGTSSNKQSFIDLEDLPLDAFQNSRNERSFSAGFRQPPRIGGPAPTYKQTTLFGQTIRQDQDPGSSQTNRNRVFRADLPPEPPSHHELDTEAMQTWVYPTNLGPTRDYQFSIVKNGLFNNTLVALPTGLGKTFIAATIMLNYFRWMKSAKIIFVAPTKPLVSQQVDACFNIAGIPRSQTTLLTGEISPGLRADEWGSKRVFFMTPQTLENDLSSGFADPKSIGLLVVDEAHRATGNYSYVKVVSFLRRFTSSFRILALTATPGSKVESVQEVIDSLGISHVEIRTEESIDIRQYVHSRDEDIVLLDPSDEMNHIKELFSKALKPLVDKLSQQNIYYGRDPMALTVYGLLQARKDWMGRAGQHVNQGVKFMMMAIFSVLTSLAHGIKLLNFHGIKPFYDSLVQFREETENKGEKGSKFKKQIIESPSFQEMMDKIDSWSKKDDFISHPKLTYLSDTVLNHFMDAGEGREGASTNTRIIVFSEYRDSAEEIVRILNKHKPLIRAAVFVGQADSKRSGGMKQAEQIERIQKFKGGEFNVLVATSIGEEGLDIGQVDLIVCYDASASPIRMLQRMGRTGRKRAGRVVLLLMRGKEEENYSKSKDGYEKMQMMICDGSRFNFRHDLSTRIVPRDIRPEVDMRAVDIPVENTQVQGLPEPKKGRAKKKKPPKKFHMPDGVETGFASVASLLGKKSQPAKTKAAPDPIEEDEVVDIPALGRVLLNESQTRELNSIYKFLPYHNGDMEEIDQVDLKARPNALRTLRKTVDLKHGEYAKRCVRLFKRLSKAQTASEHPYSEADGRRYLHLPMPGYAPDSDGEVTDPGPARKKRKMASPTSDDDDEVEEVSAVPSRPKKALKPTKPSPAVKRHILEEIIEDGDEDEEEDLPPPRKRTTIAKAQSKPKAKAKAKATTPKKSRGRPKKTQHPAAYDESADEGDDCRRTSDLELTEDSDNGSDLVDFIAGDDEATSTPAVPTSSMSFVARRPRHRSTSPTSPSSSVIDSRSRQKDKQGQQKPKEKQKPYYEPTRFAATQDSLDTEGDDGIPSMSQLVRSKRASEKSKATASSAVTIPTSPVDSEDDDGSDTDVPVRRGAAARDKGRVKAKTKRQKRFVSSDNEDDDDDDDDDNEVLVEESDGY
ncbi:P-loop containing nucleoside triphosphate hydrolase protein [Annulohypoxylon truncatum]|uniref:P-loop containing nucleoside triphosphate hydrolase protein n=1 Tax=Annulohypoxylon truncatum TaxID=327061 RepID=UPI002008AADA|nr:P-loop containing nucleoside triphosphate hydrolase protein [Annulohypoxylon truncatum]KAI1213849.1 P-loop containing nucleoside triphosphate hydrolase protein [Annulohypoxylon truncatum]